MEYFIVGSLSFVFGAVIALIFRSDNKEQINTILENNRNDKFVTHTYKYTYPKQKKQRGE